MKILDPCCGSKMMWFDKNNQYVLFGDRRIETHYLKDRKYSRLLEIKPDIKLDFTKLPFPDNHFKLVVFDPPHLIKAGNRSWLAKKYGKLGISWQEDLQQGFSECFRVLETHGILIFKWNENQIKVSDILKLTTEKPLFGHVSMKHKKNQTATHWFTFMKGVNMEDA